MKKKEMKKKDDKQFDLANEIKRLLMSEYKSCLCFYGDRVRMYKANDDKTLYATRYGDMTYAEGQANMCATLIMKVDELIAKSEQEE